MLRKILPVIKYRHRATLTSINLLVLLWQICCYAEQDTDILFHTGITQFEQQQYDAAISAFTEALHADPENGEIRFFLGLAHLASGDLQLAGQELLQARRLNWNRHQVFPALARVLLEQGHYRQVLTEIIAEPDDSTALRKDIATLRSIADGQLYRQQGEYTKAVAAFNRVLTEQPQNVSALFGRAESHIDLNQLEQASADLKQLRDMDAESLSLSMDFLEVKLLLKKSDLPAAEKRLGQILLASDAEQVLSWLHELWSADPHPLAAGALLVRSYLQQDDARQALNIAGEVYRRYPVQPVALRVLIQALLANEEPDDALAYCRRLIDLVPHSAENWTLLATIQSERGEETEASESLNQALELQPVYLPAHVFRIEQALSAKHYDDALAYSRQLQVLTPDQGIGHKLEGDVYSYQGDYYRAELAYRNAYEKTPSAAAALLLSNAQYYAEKPEAALSTLQKWLAVQPTDTSVRIQLATLLDRLGYKTDAIAEYERIIEQDPHHTIALNNLAWVYGTANPKGLEYAERAVDLSPERPEVLDTLGWLLVKSNQTEHGVLLLQQAVILAPDMADIRFHLAYAYDKLGRIDEAREELDILLNDADNPRFTQSEELQKLLEKLKYQ